LFRNFSKHLLPAVIVTVLLGAAVAFALTLFLTWLVLKIPPTGTLPAPSTDGTSPFLDVLKVALTVSAGIGGAVALVVAYRRQRHLEVDEGGRRSRYTSAAQQLGDPQAAVRLAGVYAMANLADEWPEQRQQCVDVLCAYLRLPWAGDPSQLEPNTTTTEHTWPDGTGQRKVTKTYSGRAGEREVRQTLVRVIASHLRPDTASTGSDISWSALDIDLTNAALPNADFSRARFSRRASFRRATFSGPCTFASAEFSRTASFREAKFAHNADFRQAHFADILDFGGAKFSRDAWFPAVKIPFRAEFAGVQFGGAVSFQDAQFRTADFGGAQFAGAANFLETRFTGTDTDGAWFFKKAYLTGTANFAGVEFGDTVRFDGAQFRAAVHFRGAYFRGAVRFIGVQFGGAANFREAQFADGLDFRGVKFSSDTSFINAALPSRSVFASAFQPPFESALKGAMFRDEQTESPQVSPGGTPGPQIFLT
jgi:uncharacterized protein YjbI with pentapeptide repeats